MSTFSLYLDCADLMTIVRDDGSGWPGGYWSSSLFVVDAYRISRGEKTELCRPTRRWSRRLEWPERIATWCTDTGQLEVLDLTPGQRAERYLALSYDEGRWAQMNPTDFRAAVILTASCPATCATAVQALLAGSLEQLATFSSSEVVSLLSGRRVPCGKHAHGSDERGQDKSRAKPRRI